MKPFKLNLKNLPKPIENELTTFNEDFAIANVYGIKAVKDTYKNALEYAKTDYKYFTELVIVLNMYCWALYDMEETELSKVYSDLYYKACDKFYSTFKDKEAQNYFFEMTD